MAENLPSGGGWATNNEITLYRDNKPVLRAECGVTLGLLKLIYSSDENNTGVLLGVKPRIKDSVPRLVTFDSTSLNRSEYDLIVQDVSPQTRGIENAYRPGNDAIGNQGQTNNFTLPINNNCAIAAASNPRSSPQSNVRQIRPSPINVVTQGYDNQRQDHAVSPNDSRRMQTQNMGHTLTNLHPPQRAQLPLPLSHSGYGNFTNPAGTMSQASAFRELATAVSAYATDPRIAMQSFRTFPLIPSLGDFHFPDQNSMGNHLLGNQNPMMQQRPASHEVLGFVNNFATVQQGVMYGQANQVSTQTPLVRELQAPAMIPTRENNITAIEQTPTSAQQPANEHAAQSNVQNKATNDNQVSGQILQGTQQANILQQTQRIAVNNSSAHVDQCQELQVSQSIETATQLIELHSGTQVTQHNQIPLQQEQMSQSVVQTQVLPAVASTSSNIQTSPVIQEALQEPTSQADSTSESQTLPEANQNEPDANNEQLMETDEHDGDDPGMKVIDDRVEDENSPSFVSMTRRFLQSYKMGPVAPVQTKDGKRYPCKQCNREFISYNHLKRHWIAHQKFRPHECSVCGRSYAYPWDLKHHMDTVHSEDKPYKCAFCGKAFGSDADLQRHRYYHTGKAEHRCSVCNKVYSTAGNLKIHMTVHTGVKPYKCKFCPKSFHKYHSCRQHIKLHTGEYSQKCEYCGKTFNSITNYKQHVNIHTGQRPFNCSYCEKTFAQRSTLKDHELIHKGEKKYICCICNKSFYQSHNYKNHLLTHKDKSERTKLCDICKRGFVSKLGFKLHRQRCVEGVTNLMNSQDTSGKRLRRKKLDGVRCNICHKAFKYQKCLDAHMAKHAEKGEKVSEDVVQRNDETETERQIDEEGDSRIEKVPKTFECQFCEKKFCYEKALNSHVKRRHSPFISEGVPSTENEPEIGHLVSESAPAASTSVTAPVTARPAITVDTQPSIPVQLETSVISNTVPATTAQNSDTTVESVQEADLPKGRGKFICSFCKKVFCYVKTLKNHFMCKHGIPPGAFLNAMVSSCGTSVNEGSSTAAGTSNPVTAPVVEEFGPPTSQSTITTQVNSREGCISADNPNPILHPLGTNSHKDNINDTSTGSSQIPSTLPPTSTPVTHLSQALGGDVAPLAQSAIPPPSSQLPTPSPVSNQNSTASTPTPIQGLSNIVNSLHPVSNNTGIMLTSADIAPRVSAMASPSKRGPRRRNYQMSVAPRATRSRTVGGSGNVQPIAPAPPQTNNAPMVPGIQIIATAPHTAQSASIPGQGVYPGQGAYPGQVFCVPGQNANTGQVVGVPGQNGSPGLVVDVPGQRSIPGQIVSVSSQSGTHSQVVNVTGQRSILGQILSVPGRTSIPDQIVGLPGQSTIVNQVSVSSQGAINGQIPTVSGQISTNPAVNVSGQLPSVSAQNTGGQSNFSQAVDAPGLNVNGIQVASELLTAGVSSQPCSGQTDGGKSMQISGVVVANVPAVAQSTGNSAQTSVPATSQANSLTVQAIAPGVPQTTVSSALTVPTIQTTNTCIAPAPGHGNVMVVPGGRTAPGPVQVAPAPLVGNPPTGPPSYFIAVPGSNLTTPYYVPVYQAPGLPSWMVGKGGKETDKGGKGSEKGNKGRKRPAKKGGGGRAAKKVGAVTVAKGRVVGASDNSEGSAVAVGAENVEDHTDKDAGTVDHGAGGKKPPAQKRRGGKRKNDKKNDNDQGDVSAGKESQKK